ncbi:DNA/RNA non-specific endonuclease [Levilactobacillus bambusae]|uniref:DNA-entry nuclease n=1 Tax=Levilactobacillus bambusae TaxID=2024736 RepID=A0A2V1N355_9LACO|nr:DNA/RNA non-specific endonuclease [Levilactobacillus bambusae]PWG00595.1 DNA-entry nuclease [Levilactobacillus bambusae]
MLLTGCSVTDSPTTNRSSSDTVEQIAKRPYQSGHEAVVKVNGNKSTLAPEDWKTNQVEYHDLDKLNRTASANTAYLENRNLAKGSLRVRQIFQPTGWHQKFVDGAPIINRGHMIAYSISGGIDQDGQYQPGQRSGDQNNPKNLFTQTAFSNQNLQTIYEDKVRDALYHYKKVIFQVQPVFLNDNLMATGVHLQALSTDKELNFNVFIYNVQPGVKFDYATGRSVIDHDMKVPQPAGTHGFSSSSSRKSSYY